MEPPPPQTPGVTLGALCAMPPPVGADDLPGVAKNRVLNVQVKNMGLVQLSCLLLGVVDVPRIVTNYLVFVNMLAKCDTIICICIT